MGPMALGPFTLWTASSERADERADTPSSSAAAGAAKKQKVSVWRQTRWKPAEEKKQPMKARKEGSEGLRANSQQCCRRGRESNPK